MNKKALFTDLDGTLLNDQKEITAKNYQAIQDTLQAGHKVVISTGRALSSAIVQAEKLGLVQDGCYAITFNGAVIYDLYQKKILFSRTIPPEIYLELFDQAEQRRLHMQTYSDEYVLSRRETPDLHIYCQQTRMNYRLTEDLSTSMQHDPYKVLAIDFSSHDTLVAFQKEVVKKYPQLDSFHSNPWLLEIVSAGVNKGAAVRWLCQHLDISLENSVAAGDAQNDIPMLQAAHVGAVVANAPAEIKAYADYVTKQDNNHDAIAEILEHFILTE